MTKPRLRLTILAVGLLAAPAGLPAFALSPAGAEVLVDRCNELAGWSVNLGWRFPGADGKVTIIDDPKLGKALRHDGVTH